MIQVRVRLPNLAGNFGGLTNRVMTRFQKEAGDLAVEHIRARLGRDDLYTLSEKYKERKPLLEGYEHLAGRSEAQPLVFSQEMYQGVSCHPQGDTLVIQVEDGKAISKDGFDYAQWWEETTHFLELGIEDIEDQLAVLMATILSEEMGLTL